MIFAVLHARCEPGLCFHLRNAERAGQAGIDQIGFEVSADDIEDFADDIRKKLCGFHWKIFSQKAGDHPVGGFAGDTQENASCGLAFKVNAADDLVAIGVEDIAGLEGEAEHGGKSFAHGMHEEFRHHHQSDLMHPDAHDRRVDVHVDVPSAGGYFDDPRGDGGIRFDDGRNFMGVGIEGPLDEFAQTEDVFWGRGDLIFFE